MLHRVLSELYLTSNFISVQSCEVGVVIILSYQGKKLRL